MSKIEETELAEINELRFKMSNIVGEIGNATLQTKLLQNDIKNFEAKIEEQTSLFTVLLEEEKKLVKRLLEKYGTGSINFETGEFTSET